MTDIDTNKLQTVIEANYRARGMTKREIERLVEIYPRENATKEEKENYKTTLSNIENDVAFRRDTKRVCMGLLSAITSLTSLCIAKAAHTCNSPKTMYTCMGLFILAGLYSYSRFSRIGETLKNEDKRVRKAELKAFKKLQKETKQTVLGYF